MPSWIEVTVEVPSEFGEAAASILFDLGSPGLECSDRGSTTSLVAYFRDVPSFDELRERCAIAGARVGRDCSPVIRSRSIEEQDWAENWKLNFPPIAIGHRLLVCPPWDVPPAPDRLVIAIEPAMAFGTGQHPTTRTCLELIEDVVATREISCATDIGTGSGVLAITLAKLGVECVYAIDNDPTARDAAASNSERNGCAPAIRIGDSLAYVPEHCDLIVANLFTNLLRELSEHVRHLLAPKGVFICSGFLAADEGSVVAAYPELAILRRVDDSGWVTLAMTRSDSP